MAAAQSRVSSAQGKLSSAQTALNQSKANRDKKAREFAAAKQAKQTASTTLDQEKQKQVTRKGN